nr:MAG TPA: hypothetical protein [Inoviridae sp.]
MACNAYKTCYRSQGQHSMPPNRPDPPHYHLNTRTRDSQIPYTPCYC